MRSKHFGSLILIFLCIFISGCVSNIYQKFFYPPNFTVSNSTGCQTYSGNTNIYNTSDFQRDGEALMRRGYGYIGSSNFSGSGLAAQKDLLEHAKAIGADIVLSSVEFQGTEQSVVPLITYKPGTTSTTYSQGTANAQAYNNRGGSAYGTASFSGSSTTTSPGTYATQIMPITVNTYNYEANFWRKMLPPIMGVRTENLPDELRQKFRRNSGALVKLVVDGSPAFYANILPGDVIIEIGDETSFMGDNISSVTSKYAGQKINIKLLRSYEEKVISIQLNSDSRKVTPAVINK